MLTRREFGQALLTVPVTAAALAQQPRRVTRYPPASTAFGSVRRRIATARCAT